MQRGLRQKLLETYPGFEPFIEEIMPKKASLEVVKLYVLQTRHVTLRSRHKEGLEAN